MSAQPSMPADLDERFGSVLVVEDDSTLQLLARRQLERSCAHVVCTNRGREAVVLARQQHFDAVLLDIGLPDIDGLDVLRRLQEADPTLPVVMLTASNLVETAVKATKLGAFDYLQKPVEMSRLQHVMRNACEKRRLTDQVEELHAAPKSSVRYGMVGASPAMQDLFDAVDRVGPADVSVLVHGESGAGKELVARALHRASRRKKQGFVALNCAAIAESLQESELFGHEKGAFTGADKRRVGRFEEANGGTLFLDEVAELSLGLQAKLLRVLQERTFSRVGGQQAITSDFRLIAATHKNLEEEVAAGRFREDLYYRIAVFELELPALRERREDIPLIAGHLLEQASCAHDRRFTLTMNAADALEAYDWPGNVRELQNAVQHAVVVSTQDAIDVDALPARIFRGVADAPSPMPPVQVTSTPTSTPTPAPVVAEAPAAPAPAPTPMPPPTATVERAQKLPTYNIEALIELAVRQSLDDNNGNVSKVIRDTGIGRTAMYRRLKVYGLR